MQLFNTRLTEKKRLNMRKSVKSKHAYRQCLHKFFVTKSRSGWIQLLRFNKDEEKERLLVRFVISILFHGHTYHFSWFEACGVLSTDRALL